MNGNVLIVDDDQAMCELIDTTLAMRGYKTTWCQSASAAIELLSENDFDVVLTDVRMPGTTGLQLCQQVNESRPDVSVVVMTAFGTMDTAVAAIRSGAYDFLTKPVELEVLSLTIARAVERRKLTNQIRLLEQQAREESHFGQLLGDSAPMHQLYDQMKRIAPSDASLLITGESGTGKELVARSIHSLSNRASQPFVAVNCAALSETLLESELFGHVRGAFTDARSERRGLFLEAQGGTLLLDEMGDMPMAMQVKLLRALEENRLRPVGSDQEIEFDVRVLAATHRDLETAVEEGQFRQDLFYRINVIQLHLPPLRSRGSDVLTIAGHFVEHFAKRSEKNVEGITEPAAEKLLAYRWPGNVRELRNVIERAVALTRFDSITVDDLPDKIRDHRGGTVFIGGEDPTELARLDEVERRYIEHVLKAVNQNRTQAARILGLDRKTLYRKLKAEHDGHDGESSIP
ncbi:MAG: sigma-54-dependent transcriptional regulator [Rubripirellula sp.]